MEYLDFELEVGSGRNRRYPVAVGRSPAGEAHGTLHFPFTALALENQLLSLENALLQSAGTSARRSVASTEQEKVETFGVAMLDTLLSGDVRSAFDVSRREAAESGKGLRVKLRIDAPELAALPWEYLFETRMGDYLFLSRDLALVRYPEVAQPSKVLTIRPPLRVLGMVASPNELAILDIEHEKLRIESAVAEMASRGLIEWTWLEGQTWRDLRAAMRTGPWHVFHFIGHGGFDTNTNEGFVAFADDDGRTRRVRATEFGRLLHDHAALRLVILNACLGARGGSNDVFSSSAASLIRRGVPAVVAMQFEISDQAAIEFARVFYDQIAEGIPVDTAVAEARISMSMVVPNSLEWGTPVLYMRSPDGVLFGVEETLSGAQQASPPIEIPSGSRQGISENAPLKKPVPLAPPSEEFDSAEYLYLERTMNRLRLQGFDIQTNINYRGLRFLWFARGRGIGPGVMNLGSAEAFFAFARFHTIELDSLGSFASACAEYTESIRDPSSLATVYCTPVAIVDGIDPDAAAAIVRSKPTIFRSPPNAHFVLPVAYDLGADSLYFPIGETMFTSIVWSRFREMSRSVLSTSRESDQQISRANATARKFEGLSSIQERLKPSDLPPNTIPSRQAPTASSNDEPATVIRSKQLPQSGSGQTRGHPGRDSSSQGSDATAPVEPVPFRQATSAPHRKANDTSDTPGAELAGPLASQRSTAYSATSAKPEEYISRKIDHSTSEAMFDAPEPTPQADATGDSPVSKERLYPPVANRDKPPDLPGATKESPKPRDLPG